MSSDASLSCVEVEKEEEEGAARPLPLPLPQPPRAYLAEQVPHALVVNLHERCLQRVSGRRVTNEELHVDIGVV